MTLVELVRSARLHTLADLKRLYRLRSRSCHPDSTANPTSTADFIALKEDYDQARAFLQAPKAELTPPVPEDWVANFFDLLSLGLFDGRQKNRTNPSFNKRLTKTATLYDAGPGRNRGDFQTSLDQLCSINPAGLPSALLALFHDLQSFHHLHQGYLKAPMHTNIQLAQRLLAGEGYLAGLAFVNTLAEKVLAR